MRLKFKKVLSKMLHFRDVHSLFHKIIFKRKWKVFSLLPTIVFDHVGKLNDKFSFLIFLTALKGMLIFPPKRGSAVLTVDVRDGVQAGEEHPLLCGAAAHVHHSVEEVGAALTSLERLGDQLVVIGQVGSAVDAAVRSVTVWQVSLEGLGLCHLHRVRWTLLAQLGAGTRRTAALGSPTKQTLKHARESRRRWGGVCSCPRGLSVKWGTHSVHGAVQRITCVAVSLEEVGELISTPHKAPGRALRGGHLHGLAPRFLLYCHERAGVSSFLVSVTGGMVASFLNPAHTVLSRALSPLCLGCSELSPASPKSLVRIPTLQRSC